MKNRSLKPKNRGFYDENNN